VNPAPREQCVVNAGCGIRESTRLPRLFDGWRQLRVDVDPRVEPDLVADLTDLSAIPTASADAVWASHCIEHLFDHQVRVALREFRRILRDDGFVCIIVPDLQAVAELVAADRLYDPIYQSAAGPVTPHDVLFGFGPAIAAGNTAMAHHCGFTPGAMQRHFQGVPFGEVMLRRRSQTLELAALARAIPPRDDAERNSLIAALEL
jgi:SAM-dependent methyltransferase